MGKPDKKSIIIICAIVLTFLVSSGVTLAYFSDYEAAMGQVTLNLTGRTELEEDVTDTQKVISIKNNADAGSNADVVVRAAVYGPDGMEVTLGEGWTQKQSDGYYYYSAILAPGESTSKITASVAGLDPSVDLSKFEIIVVHESAPAIYDSNGKVQKPEGWGYIPSISAPALGE